MPSDEVLIVVYGEVKIPADRLLADQASGDSFIQAVGRKTIEPINRQRELGRVLTLRKMGRLPRLQRKRKP